MIGRRVMPNAQGWLPNLEPGDYGRVDVQKTMAWLASEGRPVTADHPWMLWQVRCPDGSSGCLSPKLHNIVEHEDGTITVSPSIDCSKSRPGTYHGFLERGMWRAC